MGQDEHAWRQIVRRALGVPELIGGDVVVEIATDLVYSAPVMASDPGSYPEFEELVGKTILEETIKAGVNVSLDRFIMDRPRSAIHGSSELKEIDNLIITNSRETDGLADLPPGIAEPLLKVIRKYVLAHPFVTSSTGDWP